MKPAECAPLWIDPKEPLWRYVKLSTLFMMLGGKVFIPTLEQLQKDEPTEGLLGVLGEEGTCTTLVDDHFAFLSEHKQWLEEKADESEKTSSHFESVLHKIWIRELGKRRCIWCWHHSQIESMALWSLYASQGVAISSDLESIRSGLGDTVPSDAYAAYPVDYSREFTDSLTERLSTEKRLSALRYPHLFKQPCYGHEKEVRFVFRTQAQKSGIEIEINPSLIKTILISPYVAPTEAAALEEVIKRLKEGDERLKNIKVSRSLTRSNLSESQQESDVAFKRGLPEKPFDMPDKERNIFPK